MGNNHDELVDAAFSAQQKAYAPYSGYHVGAAVLTSDGKVFTGVNVENAVYPATICAERVAITKAVSEGCREFVAIAVVTDNGGAPCGICRQVMYEFAPDMKVLLASGKQIISEFTVSELLPEAFGPSFLP